MTRNIENGRVGFWLMQDAGISTDTIIYHYYMTITHLCNMLDNGSFRVSRKFCFEDEYEHELLTTKKMFAFKIISNNAPPQDSKTLQNKINSTRLHFSKKAITPTSCWSMGPRENLLMWRAYTSPNNGVCIKTTIGKFVESLYSDNYELWCGRILYEEREQTTDISDAEWMKHPEYASEKEIRFYFKDNGNPPYPTHDNSNAIFVGLDMRNMIDKIILSPYMWDDDVKRWEKYLTENYKLEARKVMKSNIELKKR
mgnify:CR=1 FL=1